MGASSAFDVIVVGLGAMGAHAVQQLAARGKRVLGIERSSLINPDGSSHGDSRLIRLGYFEDPSYVPLLHRAYANWRALEAASREELLTITGVLQIGRPEGKIVSGVLASCKMHGLAREVLDREQMARRYPAFQLDEGEVAVLEPQGGFVRPERAILAALRLAGDAGAELHFGERVTAIEPDGQGVTVRAGDTAYRAASVIVAAGSYIAGLVPELAGIAVPIRQVVGWFGSKDPLATALGRMPVFLRDEGEEGSFFGFPHLGGDGVKIGKHAHFREPINPEVPNAPANPADKALLGEFAARRLPLLAEGAVRYSTCRYTLLPGEDFLLDLAPASNRIVIASPCSGHGFKFASVIGEILADLALEQGTDLSIGAFSFEKLMAKAAAA
ncbi:N-methyl-L-tryptophan oxidase [Radicibacter daui]|uniref:N-methyl-L-tryptophan oxidase n=1 Tax=Radicibacter daui TaxID=3064829 RepID=UPI004047027A